VAARLGIDYEALRRINKRIVYCSINGYGNNGPYNQLPNHDINCAGVSGLLDPGLYGDNAPKPLTVQVADVGSALLCVIGILGLLIRGLGGYVEVSMTEAAMLFNTLNMAMVYEGSEPTLTGKYPFYNIYKCRDGYISIGAIEDKFWMNLCKALKREDLISRKLDKSAINELAAEFGKYSVKEILKLLWDNDIPAAPINKIDELDKDPQLTARGFVKGKFLTPS